MSEDSRRVTMEATVWKHVSKLQLLWHFLSVKSLALEPLRNMTIVNLVYRTRFIMALLREGMLPRRRSVAKTEILEDYIDTVLLVYDFKGPTNLPIRLIGNKNRVLLPIVTVLSFCEFLKYAYNGIYDNTLHRLYLCGLVSIDLLLPAMADVRMIEFLLQRSAPGIRGINSCSTYQ